MMVLVLVAGIGLIVVGLVAIGFGIQDKEFSFGSTLIQVGTVSACTGVVMLGLWLVIQELKNLAHRLGAGLPAQPGAESAMGFPAGSFPISQDKPAAEAAVIAEPAAAPSPASPPPWLDEAGSRGRGEVPSAPQPEEAAPAPKRRNLLFSSTSRKERERAQTRTSEPLTPDLLAPDIRPNPSVPPPAPEANEPPAASFDDAWPKSERSRPADIPPRRPAVRPPSTFSEANGAPAADRRPPAPREEQPPVTVLKSGVVDGMAYSLYSDGSIEAQMPEGMMRFASIDELRSHLDQRP